MSICPGLTYSVVDSDWFAAGRTVSTSSDCIHSDGIVCSRLKSGDRCSGDMSRYSELLNRPTATYEQ